MMNNAIKYRELSREEISKLNQLDRTETINDIYYVRNGILVLEKLSPGEPSSPGEGQLDYRDHWHVCFHPGFFIHGSFRRGRHLRQHHARPHLGGSQGQPF